MRNLPDWIDSYMEYTDNSEPPSSFRRWVAISVIAAALKRKCYIEWGTIDFFPNLYVVLCSPPGRARKGTAMKSGMDFLTEPGINTHLAAEAITREALIRELKNCGESFLDEETRRMIFHSSITVFSQELTVFLGYKNLQFLSDLTDWYDCRKKWVYRTKGSGTDSIDGVFVNLIGATTPQLIQSSMPLDAMGGGLTSRMVFVFESQKGKVVATPFVTDRERELKEKLYKDLESISRMGGRFEVSEGFIAEWAEWYTKISENDPPFRDERFAGYFERRPATIMKLSMIVNASRTTDMNLKDQDLFRAVKFLEEVEVNMPHALSGVGRNSYSGILPNVMVEIAEKGEITEAELLRFFSHDLTKWDLDKILDSLEAQNFCTRMLISGKIVYNEEYDNI